MTILGLSPTWVPQTQGEAPPDPGGDTPDDTNLATFNGTDQSCTDGTVLTNNPSITALSLGIWVKTSNNNRAMIGEYSGGSSGQCWRCSVAGSDFQALIRPGGTTQKTTQTTSNITNNVWRHCGFVYDGAANAGNGTLRTYLDGVLSSDVGTDNPLPSFSSTMASNFWIGYDGNSYFLGNLRDVRIAYAVWDASDFLAMYNGGTPAFNVGPQKAALDWWWGVADGQDPTLDTGDNAKNLPLTNATGFWT